MMTQEMMQLYEGKDSLSLSRNTELHMHVPAMHVTPFTSGLAVQALPSLCPLEDGDRLIHW